MPPLLWLALAVAAGVAAYALGWPAWRAQREREQSDLNAERYLAWRGRATRPAAAPRRGMTSGERLRVTVAGALAAVAAIGLIAFFVAT